MEALMKENRLELAVCGSKPSSFQDLLVSQQELVYSQIDQLENIVLTQCNLTGVNPLSQEMAAGALSIKIGKRPRDLLNPKAVKYMQSVFSIKDAITKKESREISALFGVTVTQVRDFFTSQRSRVRRFVRLSRDKALRSTTSKEVQDGDPMNIDPTIPIYPVPLKVQDGVPMNTDPTIPIYPIPLNSVGPASNEEGPSCSTQEEPLPGLDDSDRHFTENIFSSMRKEETFSGQVKLMEWILQIQNASVLLWFLTKGGVMILATWLSQAANEEQTSVLHAILKVLSHLPLHKALPVHMSAILQSVNSLRFYWTSDISNRARFLLSRWSKIFARSQAMKKPNAVKSSADAQNEMLLKQSISEIMGDESWESKIDGPDGSLVPSFEGSENFRKFEPLQPLKLLPAPVDDSSKKLIRGVSSSQTRERRKVLMVEQPGQKTAGRSLLVARSVTATQGRPLSADDIQKAKMRAQFMQSKYGKSGASSGEGHQVKTEGLTKVSFSPARTLLSVSKAHVQPQVEEHKDSVVLPPQGSIQQEAPIGKTMNLDPYEPLWKKCKRVQIAWQTPAEMRIHEAWSVSTGENSKEVEVQRNRIRREKETIYRTSQEVPSNPKEPWDREMEYDDTLTPEIPTEQLPDGDGGETLVSPRENETNNNAVSLGLKSTTTQNGNGGSMPEPDLELLAVLLKNPELVFALTSGQGVGSLSSEETVRLLDMIKANGVAASLSSLSGGGLGGRNAEESVQVSLPSPTPSSDPVTMRSGWRPPEVSKNPFSRGSSEASVSNPINFMAQQQAMPQYSLAQTATVLPEKLPLPPRVDPQFHQTAATISPPPNTQQIPPVLRMENVHAEAASFYVTPAPISITINAPGRQQPPLAYPSALTPLPPEPQHTTHSWVANQNHYNNAFVGGGGGGGCGPLPRDRNEYVGGRSRFESWSPDRSPMRSTEYNMSGWNFPEPGMDMGGGHNNYRSELDDQYHHHHHHDRSRPPRNSSSGYRDSDNRHGNRRWRDDRRR